jgi:hypothetical protein
MTVHERESLHDAAGEAMTVAAEEHEARLLAEARLGQAVRALRRLEIERCECWHNPQHEQGCPLDLLREPWAQSVACCTTTRGEGEMKCKFCGQEVTREQVLAGEVLSGSDKQAVHSPCLDADCERRGIKHEPAAPQPEEEK